MAANFITADMATACKCLPPPAPTVHAQQVDAVFAGVALQVGDHAMPADVENPEGYQALRTTFLVTAVWKGLVRDTLAVVSGQGGGDCGYVFEPGRRYLVYAYVEDGDLGTDICTRTTPFATAFEDRSQLREPVWVKPIFEYRLSRNAAPRLTGS